MAVPPNLLGFAESAGLAAVAYGPDSREAMNPATDLVRNLATKLRNPMSMLTEVIEHLSQVKADKGATLVSLAPGADLILAGINEQGVAASVAQYHGIPLAALDVFPAQLWASGGLGPLVTKETDDAARRALGLPAATGSATRLEIQAYEQLCVPGLAAEWAELDVRRPFVGALTLELPTDADDEVSSWTSAGTPPIYFGFGSTPIASWADTVTMIGAACAELGERALICSGPNDFTQIPQFDHVKVVDAVRHAAIFPACRAVVHHGGAGTTAAGMRAGLPTLILWFWLDQPMWAGAIERLKVGSGRAFSATTPQSLVADLRSILTAQCRARAREIAAQMTEPAKSMASAADLLEDAARVESVG
ncbi:putative glycosyltransferase [Mycobacterium lacus]|uniref:Putative glycosyltransferase n=2 Tax=Mycobacterium lacus TaxID=169765 RepID=A0A7I7NJW6_9MYCO|nr:putative glycosyltransferase [Mycobacterium lacus]